MAPLPEDPKEPFSLGVAESSGPPSTWKILVAVTGAAWYTYGIISSCSKIWGWMQQKIALHQYNKLKKEQLQKELKRRSRPVKLHKRFAPFNAAVNTIEWTTRIIRWIYHQADALPYRIQRHVDREYRDVQEKEWEIKNELADEKVKEIFAKEFPRLYRKIYLEPYEEGSELWAEGIKRLEKAGSMGGMPSKRRPTRRDVKWWE